MHSGIAQLWILVSAASALATWWLGVRPRSSFRGSGNTMSVLIVLMAVLLGVLAIRQPPRSASAAPPPTVSLRY